MPLLCLVNGQRGRGWRKHHFGFQSISHHQHHLVQQQKGEMTAAGVSCCPRGGWFIDRKGGNSWRHQPINGLKTFQMSLLQQGFPIGCFPHFLQHLDTKSLRWRWSSGIREAFHRRRQHA